MKTRKMEIRGARLHAAFPGPGRKETAFGDPRLARKSSIFQERPLPLAAGRRD